MMTYRVNTQSISQLLHLKYNFIPQLNLMSNDINMVIPSQNQLGAVYISGIDAARSPNTLKDHRIGAIVSVTKQAKLNKQKLGNIRYLYIPAQDKESFQISQFFEATCRFIEQSRKFTNVLVHCIAGVSRSATIVAAYIMTKYELSAQKTISLLQKRRKKISPNKGFRRQLEQIQSRQKQKQNHTLNPYKISMTQSLPKQFLIREVQTSPNKICASPTKQCSSKQQKKQKIVKKIQKIKLSLISKMKDTQQVKRKVKTVQSEQVSFSNLLQSNIYQNKIKMKV